MEDLLTQKPPVIILGAGRGCSELIHALNTDYRIEPYLFAGKRLAAIPGLTRCKFVRLRHPENRELVIQTLLDFSPSRDDRQTMLLIPGTPEYSHLVEKYRQTLEAFFILLSVEKLGGSLPTLMRRKRREIYF